MCVTVLRNLAENVETERKMTKRKLVSYLIPMLHRDNEELVMLVADFLRKLVLNPENLQAMAADNIVQAVMPVTVKAPELGQKVIACCACADSLHLG